MPKVETLSESNKQGFVEHLIELRSCLIKAFIGWVVGASITYILILSGKIINILLFPLYTAIPHQKVFFKTFPEVFSVYIKLSIIGGFILGSPYIFYQLWSFIAPGLYPHEKKWVKSVVFLTCFAFLTGDIVAYFIFLPSILKFLYSFGERFLIFKPFLKDYINFCLKFFITFGLVFQIPSFLLLLCKLEIVSIQDLKRFRPYAVILSFLIAAVVTGGADPLNQILIAIPLTLLYEAGIILIKITSLKRRG